ncbi:HTH-type transcriptional regulatory protein GabR [bioreactor metagenome]|uniref:HTH-type transcriptional regulatory protein GabR n=1 Tax=bioreactor metagenome TaxID=1076179 RepID=A0A644TSM0_9ZZZZ|nr:PLP-dependent aminotransferase family protein [Negativicutes bacterium]
MTDLIFLDSHSSNPLYMQLYEYFKAEIEQHKLSENEKLPSIRSLANSLSVSKTTVEKAYQQLMCEGYINNRDRACYVVNKLEEAILKPAHAAVVPKSCKQIDNDKPRYDFASGEMDLDGFDFSVWRRYVNKVLANKERFMGYGQSKGEDELRKQLVRYVRSRGVECQYEQIIIGPGVQSLLNILCSLLKPTHSSIAFEEPGFATGRRVWNNWGYAIVPVRMRKEGVDIQELARSEVRAVYLTPSHQFPTGYIMPVGERMRLLAWAQQTDAVIIEDDYDSEFRYSGRPIPAMKGLDSGGKVVYLGSFSKVIPPSLRISYMILPNRLLEIYERNSALYNQAVSTIEQLTLAQYMADGHLERQIRRLRKLYYDKKLQFIDTIQRIFGNKVAIQDNESGLFIVLTVKCPGTSQTMFLKALEQGCQVAPIQNYYWETVQESFPRVILYFSKIPVKKMEEAIRLLKKAWFEE